MNAYSELLTPNSHVHSDHSAAVGPPLTIACNTPSAGSMRVCNNFQSDNCAGRAIGCALTTHRSAPMKATAKQRLDEPNVQVQSVWRIPSLSPDNTTMEAVEALGAVSFVTSSTAHGPSVILHAAARNTHTERQFEQMLRKAKETECGVPWTRAVAGNCNSQSGTHACSYASSVPRTTTF